MTKPPPRWTTLLSRLEPFEKRALVASLLLAVVVAVVANQILPARFPFGVWPQNTPYQLKESRFTPTPIRSYDGHAGPSYAILNYRGGRFAQMAYVVDMGITGRESLNGRFGSTRWQHNLDGDMVWAPINGALFGGLDWNQDGRDEVFYYGRDEQGGRHVIGCFDPVPEKLLGLVSLPGGPDRYEDGHWDGYYRPVGFFPWMRDDGTRTRALVVTCLVRYDGLGRGIFAVDLERNEILWKFTLAGSPMMPGPYVHDLDGDGRAEIIVSTNAPGNLTDHRVNGMSDSQSMVVVLDDRGQVCWARVTGTRASTTRVHLVDLEQDGKWEVITSNSSIERPYAELVVWDGATGDLRYRETTPFNFNRTYLLNSTQGIRNRLVLNTFTGGYMVFGLGPDGFTLLRQVRIGVRMGTLLAGDLLPSPGDEILAMVPGHGLYIHDLDLKVKAHFPVREFRGSDPAYWEPDEDHRLLLFSGGNVDCFEIVPRPWYGRIPEEPLGLASLFLLATTGSLALRRRQRSIYRRRLDIGDPDILRELRLRLLSDLELSGHGAVGVLRSFRRLVWNLETRAAGIGESPEMNRRLEAQWNDFHKAVLPHVRDILSLAEKADILPHTVIAVREVLDQSEQMLSALAADGFPGSAILEVLPDLQLCSEEAEAGMQKIRSRVEDMFRADWGETWGLVLRARAEGLENAGVQVIREGPATEVFCRLDPKQLEFMLDNLVGNAIRAMAESSDPRLTITTRLEDGLVIGEVRDTGWGIALEDWDRIMETPYSSRKGGGLGLFETQRILRLFGGEISVKSSRAGEGTTLRIVAPQSRS